MTEAPQIISALLGSGVMRRLQGVSQAGAPALRKKTRSVTRYEHSVGVWSLAHRLGMPAERQVTALLHDATHTAFSHTADYLFHNRAEDSHEQQLGRLLNNDELRQLVDSALLGRALAVIVERPFWLKLLDAVDYTLRDLECAGLISEDEHATLIELLCDSPQGPVFRTCEAAGRFLELMEQAAVELYRDAFDLFLHRTLADIMAAALRAGVLPLDTILSGQDRDVLDCLRSDARFAERLRMLIEVEAYDLAPTGKLIFSKPRLLIPLVMWDGGKVASLGEIEPGWLEFVADSRARAEEGIPLLTWKSKSAIATFSRPA